MNVNNLHKFIEDSVFKNPLPLLALTQHEYVIDKVNSYLPYSTGFEIECNNSKKYDIENFKRIPDIMHISYDSEEQRYRIPHGVLGIICLYNICQELKYNSELNPSSGIHYHVDLTDCFSHIDENFIKSNEKWILEELDTWEYTGTYNPRSCGINSRKNWVNFQSGFKTAEFRIGEMSFDYELIFKRIHHCNLICRKIKELLLGYDYVESVHNSNVKLTKVDSEFILQYIKDQQVRLMSGDIHLIKYKSKFEEKENKDNPDSIISNRVIDRRNR